MELSRNGGNVLSPELTYLHSLYLTEMTKLKHKVRWLVVNSPSDANHLQRAKRHHFFLAVTLSQRYWCSWINSAVGENIVIFSNSYNWKATNQLYPDYNN